LRLTDSVIGGKFSLTKEGVMSRNAASIALLLVLSFTISCQGKEPDSTQKAQPVSLQLERFDGGFFSLDKPKGWQIIPAGACATFAFLAQDPGQPLRQIFYFGEVGPVYLSQAQKLIDIQYVNMGGFPSPWMDMPVIDPLTPQNFLAQFHLIAQTNIARQFMPQCPRLENFQVIAAVPQPCPIPGGGSELIRALFTRGEQLGEGLFVASVAPLLPSTGGPGGGIGQGFLIVGVTAPKMEFPDLESTLVKSVASFTIEQSYVNDCMRQQERAYQGILKAGKTLSETSDIIMQGWENRNRSEDILSEKTSDAILGRERLYDPESGQVYQFENGFYDTYKVHQSEYEMNNLQPLPEDSHQLWTTTPLDGNKYVR
jgi:hypothetical protein